ncbi:hypothetical protein QYF36_007017 [Acer negundo]|nr:hypothetical protein QYF36_007017 [Acer negundo]
MSLEECLNMDLLESDEIEELKQIVYVFKSIEYTATIHFAYSVKELETMAKYITGKRIRKSASHCFEIGEKKARERNTSLEILTSKRQYSSEKKNE